MSSGSLVLARSPIIEAVVDIDCDLPADVEFVDLEAQARERFADRYPGFRRIFHPASHLIVSGESPPQFDVRAATDAFQLLSEDEPQLVQVRRSGFSFNRFRPYKISTSTCPRSSGRGRFLSTCSRPYPFDASA